MDIKVYNNYKKINISNTDKIDIDYINGVDCDFIVCERDTNDVNSIIALDNMGFFFADRLITAQVPLNKISADKASLIRFNTAIDNDAIDDVKKIASLAFVRDRRFHLRREYDMNFAAKIIPEYVEEVFDDSTEIIVTRINNEIIGFIFLKKLTDNRCEITLGAVHPKFQNLGASVSLYLYTSFYAVSQGYKTMIGKISSVNLNSLNMFLFLGARFSDVNDIYILEKKDAIR
ncbi:MAG: GNAT family N-acetyltransferase [Bacillota bacterium]